DLPGEQALVARLYAGESDGFELEKRYLRPDGSPVWANLTVASVAVSGKDQPLHLCLVEDINARKAAEQRIQETLRLLQVATQAADIGIWNWEIPTGKLEWDERLCDWYEVPEAVRQGGLLYDFWKARLHPDDRERAEAVVATAIRDQIPYADVLRILLPGDRVRYLQTLAVMDRDADGTPRRMVGVNRDITARLEQEEALRASEERFRLAFENANTGMCLVDPQGLVLRVNDGICAFFGRPREEIEGRHVNVYAYPDDQALSPGYITRAVQGNGDLAIFEKRFQHRDGHLITALIASSLVRDAQGQPQYFISQVQDITERKATEAALAQAMAEADAANQALQKANQELQRLATTDGLTGLWNRRYFEQVAATEVGRATRYGDALSLLMFDIDHFKAINDTHGHLVGDQVLIGLTHLVGEHLRSVDVLARWGGEEFVVLLPHCPLSEARMVADKLRLLIAGNPFPAVGNVTSSFGVAEYRPSETAEAWLSRADKALYGAKTAGRNRVVSG
ncbi:MAG: diguanylate cyclase, partial [Sphingobacteriia bacterium]|nr:diguanylate cyclase [Sphingobacteriia bacterium]